MIGDFPHAPLAANQGALVPPNRAFWDPTAKVENDTVIKINQSGI